MESDFLVIGSGIAGLSFALKCAELGSVVVVTKKRDVDTATNLAQGGIAAVLEQEDSVESHVQDTLDSGAGLCDEEIVRLVVENGPARVQELVAFGVDFVKDKGTSSGYSLGREGGTVIGASPTPMTLPEGRSSGLCWKKQGPTSK